MKLNIKEILWLFAMGLFYITIGLMGNVFPLIYVFSFILGVPYIIYIYKKGVESYSLLLALIIVAILIFSDKGKSALMIVLLVFIPSLISGLFFNKKINLSKNLIQLSIIYFLIWIGIIIIWDYIYNVNLMESFYSIMNSFEEISLNQLIKVFDEIRIDKEGVKSVRNALFKMRDYSNEDITKLHAIYRLVIKYYYYLIQYLFPVFVFVFAFFSSFIQVLVSKLVLDNLTWEAPSLKQLFNIAVRPLTIVLVGLMLIIRTTITSKLSPELIISIDNILVIFLFLMFLIGLLFAIHIIKNSDSRYNFKLALIILTIINLILSPFLFISLIIMLGIFETIFNFRNKERFL